MWANGGMAGSPSLVTTADQPSASVAPPSPAAVAGGAGRRRFTTVVAWTIWAVTIPIGGSCVGALDRVLRRYPATRGSWDSLGDVGFIVAAIAAGTVGAVVASRRPRHPVGWLFLTIGGAVVAIGGTEKLVAYALLARPDEIPGAALAAALSEPLFALPLGLVALVLLLTPTGHLPSRRWRPVAWAAAVVPPAAYVALLLSPREVTAPFNATPSVLAVDGLDWLAGVAEVLLAATWPSRCWRRRRSWSASARAGRRSASSSCGSPSAPG